MYRLRMRAPSSSISSLRVAAFLSNVFCFESPAILLTVISSIVSTAVGEKMLGNPRTMGDSMASVGTLSTKRLIAT